MRLLHKILLLLFSFFLLCLVEGVCYLVYSPSRLEKVLTVLEQHPIRMWQNRRNFSDDFFGAKVRHNDLGLREIEEKKQNGILVMGGSPSYGWGETQDKTYSRVLERKLLENELEVPVVNGSMIGYSSFQGEKLLKEIWNIYNPKMVIISYVINDVDYYRFYNNGNGPDNSVLIEKSRSGLRLLSKLYTVRMLKRIIGKLKGEYIPFPQDVRVSIKDYQKNIEGMIIFLKSKKISPVLLKFPVNLPNKINMDKISSEFKKINCFEENIGKVHQCLVAMYGEFWSEAISHDFKRILATTVSRRARKYNQVMDLLAKKHQITIIDIVKAFKNTNDYLFLNKKLDPIHLNNLGHEIIAEEILKKIIDRPYLIK